MPHLPSSVLLAKAGGIFIALLACAVLPAKADPGFQGFSVGGQVSFVNASTELSIPNDDEGQYNFQLGQPSQMINLQAAYSLAVGEQAVLGIGASYHPGTIPAGSSVIGEGVPFTLELENMRVVYIEPGYAPHPGTLIYGKFALSTVKAVLTVKGDDGPEKLDTTLKGYGFGVGLRHLLTPNLYFQVEFLQLAYSEESLKVDGDDDVRLPIKAGATMANIGLGLQF